MNSKKELFIVIGKMCEGGTERFVSRIIEELVEDYCVNLIILVNSPSFYSISTKATVYYLGNEHTPLLIKAIRFRKIIKKHKSPVVISFLFKCCIFTFYSLIGINKYFVSCDRTDPARSPKNFFIRFLRNRVYKKSNKLIVQTRRSYEYFKEKNIYSTAIPNFIELGQQYGKALSSNKTNTIVWFGRFVESKNLPMLLNAFNKSDIIKDYKLNLYGNGPCKMTLQNEFRESIQTGKISFFEWDTQLFEKLLDSKIFVLTSDYEGMPNSLLEAMALGIVPISTNVNGADELILNGENGFILQTGNLDSLITVFNDIYLNKYDLNKMSKLAFEATKPYLAKRIISLWKDIIDSAD